MKVITKRACPWCKHTLDREMRRYKHVSYICEICNRSYPIMNDAVQCEAKGPAPTPKGHMGEEVAVPIVRGAHARDAMGLKLGRISKLPSTGPHHIMGNYEVSGLRDGEIIGTLWESQIEFARQAALLLTRLNKEQIP